MSEQKSSTPTVKGKNHSSSVRLLVILLLMLVVLAVVAAAAWRDGTGFDAIHRLMTYGNATGEDREGYLYAASSANRYVTLNENLVVLSTTELSLISDTADIWSTPVHMTTPALLSAGSRVVAWDVGGSELYVVGPEGEDMTLTSAEPLISATLNDEGWLAVTAEESGNKGAVTVYDSALEQPVFRFHSARHFISTAIVTEDCRYLAAVTYGRESSSFVSGIIFYDLSEEDPVATWNIPEALVLAVGNLDGRVAAVSDERLDFLTLEDGIVATCSYSGSYLREYELGGDSFVALLLSLHKSGSLGRLVTVDSDGEELASLEISDQVLDISAAGRYLAVLYADRCVIYTPRLEEYAVREDTGDVKAVRMRSDGSALLLTSDSALLFLP